MYSTGVAARWQLIAKDDDEIKNTKDTKYKYIPLEKYKTQEGYSQNNDIFETLLDENQAMSIRTIGDKYELMKNYIQGENPLYKTLLEKSPPPTIKQNFTIFINQKKLPLLFFLYLINTSS